MEASGARRALHIDIAKQIPVGAGLGGGSANAGAVLLAVNRLLGEPLNVEELHRIAWRLGADVPFFLQQRPALATGIGEHLEGVDGLPPYPLVLMKPALSVSTRWVYQSLKLTRGGSRIKVDRLLTSPWCVQEFMENDLESVTLQEFPVLAQMKEWLMAQGALGALMSGSGPTVFGVFPDRDHAQRVAEMGGEKWAGCWVSAAEVLSGFAAGS
jgi:4-diphosphocytidyl-2-C-methyl-D-erythritol kinase